MISKHGTVEAYDRRDKTLKDLDIVEEYGR